MSHPHLAAVTELPLHQHLGLRLIEAAAGRSKLELTVSTANANVNGVLHGGVIHAICDVAAYAALLSLLADHETAVTHDLHVSCMRPAPMGSVVRVEANVVKKGRTLAFTDATASIEGKLVATARVTKSVVPL